MKKETKHRFIGCKVQCTDRPDASGIITYYNPDNGCMDITYNDDSREVLLTHISKCKIIA